jgi:hypothetical protein
MAFVFFGGASVIVCQGADLLAIRPRRPPQGDTALCDDPVQGVDAVFAFVTHRVERAAGA